MVLPRAVSHPLSDSLKLLRLTQDGFLPAGKRKSGKTRDGNRWLKRTVCQASWAVTRKKNCYLAAQFRRMQRNEV